MATAKKDVKAETKVTRNRTKKEKTEEVKKENDLTMEILMKQIRELENKLKEKEVKSEETKNEETIVVEKKENRKRVSFTDIRDREVEVKRVIGGIGNVKYIDKKTGDEYSWNEEGGTEFVTVDVLKRMNTRSPLFLKSPWLRILDDEEAVEVLGLKSLYENIDMIEDVNELAKLSEDELIKIVESLSLEYKNILATNIVSKINLEEITNISVIRRFERVLKKEFNI